MSTTVTAETFLARSIQLATANVLNSGGPFGAVIVTADGQAFDGVNRVTATTIPPPTPRSRPSAAPAASWARSTSAGPPSTAAASHAPCASASALWARMDRVVFAADRHDAASVGFDDAVFYEYFDNEDRDALMPVSKLELGDPQAPAILEPFTHLEHARFQD